MPRKAEGARLYLRRRKGRDPVYVILDQGGFEQSTGCGADEVAGAEKAFSQYLGTKHKTSVGAQDPAVLSIADVLTFYADAKLPPDGSSKAKLAAYETLLICATHLTTFFGADAVSTIRGASCRDYLRWRAHRGAAARAWPPRRSRVVGDQTVRRELVVLAAAVNLYHKEYGLDVVPAVTLPPKAPSSRTSLTRHQAARLLAGALGFRWSEDGSSFPRRPRSTRTQRKRAARFIIIALYSGTRHSAVTAASWIPCTDGPWIDIDKGILHRRGDAEEETKKRRPPAKIPPRLLAHLRRWRRMDMELAAEPCRWVIAKRGERLAGRLRKGWSGARDDGGLDRAVTPHVLRHTCGTWLANGGIKSREAADFLGMTEQKFEDTYYHAHPDFQRGIGAAFDAAKRTEADIGNGPKMPKQRSKTA